MFLVAVAQLVERWSVEPVVAGSNPVGHPVRNYVLFLIKPRINRRNYPLLQDLNCAVNFSNGVTR